MQVGCLGQQSEMIKTTCATNQDRGFKMNNDRRKALEKLSELIEDIKIGVEFLRDDEQNAFDSLPESFQYSDKGNFFIEAIDNLDYAIGSLEDAIGSISESCQS